MVELHLDGQRIDVEEAPARWGELLERIENRHLDWNRIIQTVRFDGEELDDFRGAAAAERSVAALGRIEVTSIDSVEYLNQLLDGAPAHLDQIGRVLADAVRLYRQNLPREASQRLHSVLVGLDVMMSLVRTAGALANWNFETFRVGERTVDEEVRVLADGLERVVDRQQAEDAAGIADALEGELAPRLSAWPGVFRAMKERLASTTAPGGR